MMAFRCPACLCRSLALSLSFRRVFGHLPRLALRPQAGDGQSRAATADSEGLVDKVSQQCAPPPKKAVPTWGDTQGPALGTRGASGTQRCCSAEQPSLWEGSPLQDGRRPLGQRCRKKPWSPEQGVPDVVEGPRATGSSAQSSEPLEEWEGDRQRHEVGPDSLWRPTLL